MSYVDGFVIPVPKKNLAMYRRVAKAAGKIWRDHGALAYRECVGEDLKVKVVTPFTRLAKTKPSETVVFAFIVFKSRKHRDKVNAAVMKDPRMDKLADPKKYPRIFDMKRMAYGGFKTIVEA
jgi:uncharacterized protein YbaA (DUF1428 family)